jgi:hypothetical protein
MNIEEAKNLLLFEGSAPNGIVVASRIFEFPNVLRIEVLSEALEQIYLHYISIDKIERNIARALFNISFHVQSNIEAAIEQKVEVPEKFLEDILIVYMLVESIFENKWLVSDSEPKPKKINKDT